MFVLRVIYFTAWFSLIGHYQVYKVYAKFDEELNSTDTDTVEEWKQRIQQTWLTQKHGATSERNVLKCIVRARLLALRAQ
jgi:hypothetical protein